MKMKKVPLFIMLLLGLNCFSQINPPPIANNVSVTTCDDDDTNDGQKAYILNDLKPQVLGAQSSANYDVNFYSNAALTAPILTPTTTLYHIYAQVFDKNDPALVSPAADVYVTVVKKPTPSINPQTICIDPKTGKITNAYFISGYGGTYNDVDGIPQPLYFFEWKDSAGTVLSTDSNFSIDTKGNYTLEIKANTPENCNSSIVSFTVNESAMPSNVTYTVSGSFTDESHSIVVTAEPYVGDGSNFLYSLDGKTPQSSNAFTDIKKGPHQVIVIDSKGCGSLSTPVDIQLVFNPEVFTPNGDGFNDKFSIKGLEGRKDVLIYIFDRCGQLMTQLFGDSEGWDGTYNGQPVPSNDYWFTVSYTEEGVKKEYKSHFSLIR